MGGAADTDLVFLALFVLAIVGMAVWTRMVEHWGIDAASQGSFRAPHGRLVSARVVEGPPAPRRGRLLVRCLALSWLVGALLVALDVYLTKTMPTVCAVSGMAFWGAVAAVAVGARAVGLRQAVLYGFAGYILFGALLLLPVAALEYVFDLRGIALYALVNYAAITGTCLGVSLAPRRLLFERRFEDGFVDRIWVSARARVFARLSELAAA